MNQTYRVFTDGSAIGNPGPGGWGAVVIGGTRRREMTGGYCRTTVSEMELVAAIEALRSALYFLHDDRLGTPQLATDSGQNTQWQASYEPFGTTTSVNGEIAQNLRFPGQYFDVEKCKLPRLSPVCFGTGREHTLNLR